MTAADPPGETFRDDDYRVAHGDEVERPLVCSNPSSYAASSASAASGCFDSSSSADSSSLRTRPHHEHDEQQHHHHQQKYNRGHLQHDEEERMTGARSPPRRYSSDYEDDNDDDDDEGGDRRAEFRRRFSTYTGRFSTFTGRAEYFKEHYSDPVESVTGGYAPSVYTRRSTRRPPSSVYEPSVAQSLNDDGLQLVCWPGEGGDDDGVPPPDAVDCAGGSRRRPLPNNANVTTPKWRNNRADSQSCHDGSGATTEGLTDDQSEDDFDDDDEDIVEEHYRDGRPPSRVIPHEPRIMSHGGDSPPPQEHRIVLRREPLEPEEYTGDEDDQRRQKKASQAIVPTPPAAPVDPAPAAQQQQRTTSSQEVVATIKNQLALRPVDPASRYGGYQHCFITIREEHRFLMLYTFLKRCTAEKRKVIVFFSTTKSTQYYARLLHRLLGGSEANNVVRAVHNGMSKERFISEFMDFSNQKGGTLCVPDFQGGDLAVPPSCDWIVQFEPCSDPGEYIFRVGRISAERNDERGGGGSSQRCSVPCRALLFLTPTQFGFLKYYKAAKVKFYEYEIPKISNVQKELIKMVKEDPKLRKVGSEAYRAYLMMYTSHEYRDIYNVHELDQKRVAMCFGFDKPPSAKDDERHGGNEEKQKFEERLNRREQNRWQAVKKEKSSWMKGEKSWRYANVHADKMGRSQEAHGSSKGGKRSPEGSRR